ncbi:MAG: hypothetical protein OER12_01980 [Acidimicrobiia bacterium]|nr:hypothetical protein [Acidimicrobiia bacterium]
MKRALVVALSVAVLTTLFGGLASADPVTTVRPDTETVHDRSMDDAAQSLMQRCRRLLGEDELADISYERCVELWKRWCKAHPRTRRCPRPDPPPRPCKVTDRVIDRCLPCKVTDSRRPCPEPPPPPPPCKITDAVTDVRCDPCRATDALRPCPIPPPVPIPIPPPVPIPVPPPCPSTDAVSDVRCDPCLTTDSFAPCPVPIPVPLPIPCDWLGSVVKCLPDPCLVTDAGLIKCEPIPPIDRPIDRPVDKPKDRIADRLTDREGNDVHLRTVDADS